jgi:hypothetical protein
MMACGIGPGCLIAAPIIIVFILMGGLFITAVLLVQIFLWWRVFSKAGYSGAFGLLFLVPFGVLIMLFILAFSQWPINKLPPQQV